MSDEFDPTLEEIIEALGDHTTDPDRPFSGQPHTDNGTRGMTEVKGIRFRDLADCCVRAWVFSVVNPPENLYARAEARDGTLNWNDLYELDTTDMDPVALIQNLACEVERAMGIYPNVPHLNADSD